MHDPFPLPISRTLANIFIPISDRFALSVLPLHIHEILLTAVAYQLICFYVSPSVSRTLFPRTYPNLDRRARLSWDVHMVSLVQSTLINVLALWVMRYDQQRNAMDWRERVYGYDGALGMIAALACGYFLWDCWMCAMHWEVFGAGMIAHAVSAVAVYGLGFVSSHSFNPTRIVRLRYSGQRPVIMYYAPVFILFELSSPFLNFHWFFDKVGMTGSTPQLVNGIVLMSTFAGSRLIWGSYNSFHTFPDMWRGLQYQNTVEGQLWFTEGAANATAQASAKGAMSLQDVSFDVEMAKRMAPKPLPSWYFWVYFASYTTLMVLNFYWFGQMVKTIRARFNPPFGTRGTEKEHEEPEKKETGTAIKAMGKTGAQTRTKVSGNAQTMVELEETEVKQRNPRRRT